MTPPRWRQSRRGDTIASIHLGTAPVSEEAIAAAIESMAKEAATGCGCSHHVYQERFSAKIDGYIGALSTEAERNLALSIAKRNDYADPDEMQAAHDYNDKHGLCSHGLEYDECPAGCSEILYYQHHHEDDDD